MDKKVIEVLTGEIKEYFKPGPGGREFRYVKGEDVISRLNQAFDHEWSSRVEKVTESANQIIVLVSIEAGGVTHQGFGGTEIAVYSTGPKVGKPVDVSNSYKAAFTNAIKKAAEQFGIGLQSDDVLRDVPVPVKAHGAPPTPATSPAGPISGSATFSTAKPVPVSAPPQDLQTLVGNVDVNALQKQIQNLLANTPTSPTQTAAPMPISKTAPESFAKTFKDQPTSPEYNPKELRQPEVANPFPATPVDGPLNDFQLNALSGLAKMKKITPSNAINMGLPDSTKSEYKELTKGEAKAVIQALNGLEG